jgi:predicted dehydrogenase
MPLDMTPEQREIGAANFHRVVGELGVTRRDFMKGLLATGAALPVSAAAYYGYEYSHMKNKPVKAALIGAGDEGGVLAGEHNPNYLEFVAVCDIRPSNQKRIFTGEPAPSPRKGLNRIYGKDARKKIKVYTDYREVLQNKDIEAVVIALPLNLHAPVAIDCLKAGKHVLCEKLMAWNVNQCKEMIKAAKENDRILAIGHQRHYSLLYAHAVEVINSGILGEIRHIRALWHRNNTLPRLDKDNKPMFEKSGLPVYRDSWRPAIKDEDRAALESQVRKYGFKSMEELVRWRLFNRTGGGLMAELGSHQLDACSIFLGKVHPLAVTGIGGKYFYRDDREVEDHVFVTFEFPGRNYYDGDPNETVKERQKRGKIKDKEDKVIVTYSSISTNKFEPYGECVMGNNGCMVVELERSAMIYPESGGRSTSVSVTTKEAGKPALDSSASGPGATAALAVGSQALGAGIPSRGYREEMEHFAYCVRMWNQSNKEQRPQPRCNGPAAMADAIIALTANRAMRGDKSNGNQPQRVEFRPEWFDPESPAVPDPDMLPEIVNA